MSAPITPDDPNGICTCDDKLSLRCPKHGTREKVHKPKFRRDHNLIPTDIHELNRIDKMIRDLPLEVFIGKITDRIKKDEKL